MFSLSYRFTPVLRAHNYGRIEDVEVPWFSDRLCPEAHCPEIESVLEHLLDRGEGKNNSASHFQQHRMDNIEFRFTNEGWKLADSSRRPLF